MAKNWDYHDGSNVVYQCTRTKTETWDGNIEHSGYAWTVNGLVEVYSRMWPDRTGHSYLELIYNQRRWRRDFSEFFQPRTLTTLAKEFAAEIAQRKHD